MKKELTQSEERHLECELTDEELRVAGEDLAHRFMDVQALITDRARINAKIKPIEQDIEKLVVKIDTKKEVRPVECDWNFNWTTGNKKLVRSDTFETIDTLDITENEKQLQIEMES